MQVITESLPAGTPVANPLLELRRYGQSIWLDYIRRHLITSGELARLVEEDGLCGVTSQLRFDEGGYRSTYMTTFLSAAGAAWERDPRSFTRTAGVRTSKGRPSVSTAVRATAAARRLRESGSLRRGGARTRKHLGTGAALGAKSGGQRYIKPPEQRGRAPRFGSSYPRTNANITLLFGREMYEQVAEPTSRRLEQFAARAATWHVWRCWRAFSSAASIPPWTQLLTER